jgi:hypothetical protein
VPTDRHDALAAEAGYHVVRPRETPASIAAGLGLEVRDLATLNPDVDLAQVAAGQTLRVRAAGRTVHVVATGETVSDVAQRHGVAVADIARWNPGLDADLVRPGQRLVVRSLRGASESIGAPTCGRLVNGTTLPPHPAYVIRHEARSYATDETVAHITRAFDAVVAAHPDSPRVRVHDLSLREGGAIDDHRSHQSGRDVDIVYYQRACEGGICPLRPVLPRDLALGPQWTLFEHWLRAGVAERIFVDYGLQELLHRYARRHGASRQQLEAWFQYPRGRDADVGVIRHFPNHFDHVHVRFDCPPDDESCR